MRRGRWTTFHFTRPPSLDRPAVVAAGSKSVFAFTPSLEAWHGAAAAGGLLREKTLDSIQSCFLASRSRKWTGVVSIMAEWDFYQLN